MMKKWLGGAMLLLMLLALWPGRAWGVELPVQAEAALLMEKETGQVLYAKNEHQAMEPASVTKVMTLLLVMEAIDSGTMTIPSPSAPMPPPWEAAGSSCPRGRASRWRTC